MDPATKQIVALWQNTNEKVAAGTFTRADWLAHFKAQKAIADDRRIQAVIQLGADMGFVEPPVAQ